MFRTGLIQSNDSVGYMEDPFVSYSIDSAGDMEHPYVVSRIVVDGDLYILIYFTVLFWLVIWTSLCTLLY
jgi:hypothetical protein